MALFCVCVYEPYMNKEDFFWFLVVKLYYFNVVFVLVVCVNMSYIYYAHSSYLFFLCLNNDDGRCLHCYWIQTLDLGSFYGTNTICKDNARRNECKVLINLLCFVLTLKGILRKRCKPGLVIIIFMIQYHRRILTGNERYTFYFTIPNSVFSAQWIPVCMQ